VTVRKPEQGTGPKLFYINGNDWSLHPSATQTHDSYMWADKVTEQNVSAYERGAIALPVLTSKSGTPIRTPQTQGEPLNGPIQFGGRVAEHMVQTAYNAQHKIQWHWELPSYLVTKSIAGGLFMLLSLGAGLGMFAFDSLTFLAAGFTAMVFMLITTILLIKDLSQPKRFLNILLRPQWKSWVARGAYIMVTFTAVAGLWWLLEAGAFWNILPAEFVAGIRNIAAWIVFPFALGVVIYTAFLLGQAEGRDMWQSNLLPFQLLSQSAMVASGVFFVLNLFVNFPADLTALLTVLFPVSIAVNLLLTFAGKLNSFPTDTAMLASREMTHGKFRNHYWWGGIALGHIIPLVLMIAFAPALPVAVLATLVGLFFYEYAFVMAPQYIPNS
jgi:formate-dependent nitrite reductase membrane component NrfD